MDRSTRASPRTCRSSAPSPCRLPTGPRPRGRPGSPACGACFPASSAPASSAARCCLSLFAFLPDARIDHLAVEQVDEIVDKTILLHRLRRGGARCIALARLDRGSGSATELAHRNLDRYRTAEVIGERSLELVLMSAVGEERLRLGHHQLEQRTFAALQFCVACKLAGSAGH